MNIRNRTIKAGIVGMGYMGQIRMREIKQHPNYELVAVCDVLQEKIEGLNVKSFADYREMLQIEMDALFICCPNAYSPEIGEYAMNLGKHVFCEKPPGRNVEDVLRFKNAERKNAHLKLMFGFNHRFHPAIIEVKKIIDSGQFGKITALRGVYGKSGGLNYLSSWRNDVDVSGGGILIDQGIHMLDLFLYFVGNFDEKKVFLSNSFWKTDGEDNAMLILRKGQILASLHSSVTLWKHTFEMQIILEEGYLNIEGFLSKTGSYGREKLIVGRRQFENEAKAIGNPREEIIYFDQDDSWKIEIQTFYESIVNDIPLEMCNSEDAMKVMTIIDEIYGDAHQSKVIKKFHIEG